MFILDTPKGQLVKVKMPNGEMKMEIRWKEGFGPEITRNFRNIQEFIDSECLSLCEEFVPKDTGILKQSGIMHVLQSSNRRRCEEKSADSIRWEQWNRRSTEV